MTDTSNVSNETQDTVQETAQETAHETAQVETQEKPKASNGYEGENFVEFTPEQQKRFNDVRKLAGKAEREAAQLREIAQQQFEIIEQLRVGQQTIVNHIQAGDYSKAESALKQQRQEAYNRGDLPAVDDINDKLNELRIQKRLSETQEKQKPQQQQRGVSGQDIVTRAVQTGSITSGDADVYRAWANETDEYGNLKRPWVNEYDSRNKMAAAEGKAVFSNVSFSDKTFAEKLNEIDRRMGVMNRNTGGSNVLPSGNLTRAAKTNTVKLTPYQEQVAVKTRFAGPGKTSQDHIEAYKAQVAAMKGIRK